MSKPIGPEGNLEFHSGTEKYFTEKSSSSQGGISKKIRNTAGRVVLAGTSAVGSLVSPVQTQVARAELSCPDLLGFTVLHGDCDPEDTTFGVFLDVKSGAHIDMAKRLARTGVKNLPAGFPERMTILMLNPSETGDSNCNFKTGYCSLEAQKVNVDKANQLLRPFGRAIHEPITLARSPYEGVGSTTAVREGPVPSIYTGATLILPDPPSSYNQELLDDSYARDFLHESLGHGIGGIDDNEGDGDVMDHMTQTLKFSDRHLRVLREKLALGIQRYAAPSVEAVLLNPATVLADQTMESSSLGLILAVYASVDTTQFFSEITPFNNDGPGAEDIIGGSLAVHTWGETGHKVPPPPEWYGLLPDMTYTWKVRTSHLAVPLTKEDQRWGQREVAPGKFVSVPGAEVTTTFRTPKRDSRNIALQPLPGGQADRQNPTLVWDNGDKDVYYYEVQVSKDPNFNTDPATANAPVYWELRHGGVTNPKNSYTIPTAFPLEKGSIYHWRVRPRIQGDGKPVAWTSAASFSVAENATIRLTSENLADFDYGNGVIGPSQAQLDKANPPPEPIQPSSLARVIRREYANGEYGEIFIPEAGAKEVRSSSPPVDVVTIPQYHAFINTHSRREVSRVRHKLTPAA